MDHDKDFHRNRICNGKTETATGRNRICSQLKLQHWRNGAGPSCPQQFYSRCCKTTEPSLQVGQGNIHALTWTMQFKISCFHKVKKYQRALLSILQDTSHFLNTQTHNDTANLMLQSLVKLAPEKLPLPWPDAFGEMGMNLSRPSADASKHITKKFDLPVAATTYSPPWRRLFSRSVPAAGSIFFGVVGCLPDLSWLLIWA